MTTITTSADKGTTVDTKRPRLGRPHADQAGEVEVRILNAAELYFLQQGYARTTLEQIAALARIGNTTLYKRYRNKEELFTAVLQRSVHTERLRKR